MTGQSSGRKQPWVEAAAGERRYTGALRVAGVGAAIATEAAITNDIVAHAIPAREKLLNMYALLSVKTTAVINLRSRRSLSQSHDLRRATSPRLWLYRKRECSEWTMSSLHAKTIEVYERRRLLAAYKGITPSCSLASCRPGGARVPRGRLRRGPAAVQYPLRQRRRDRRGRRAADQRGLRGKHRTRALAGW